MNGIDPRLLAALEQDPGFARFIAGLSGTTPANGQAGPLAIDWRTRPQSNNVIDLRGQTGHLLESPYGPGTMMASGLMPPAPLPRGSVLMEAAGGDDGSGITRHILRGLGFADDDQTGEPFEGLPSLATVFAQPTEHSRRGLDPREFERTGTPWAARYPFTNNRVYRNRSGRFVVDSQIKGKDGKVPTHRIDMLPEDVQFGRISIEDFERSVLARPADQFSPVAKEVNNSLASLNPDARPAIERMMAAARAAGFDVYVNETRRPQERQDWLFQQGRSRPGPVITWTLTSDHRDGHAADLRFNSDAGYRWMWANAGRFGLYTLGPGDPGHVGMQTAPAQSRANGSTSPAREAAPAQRQSQPQSPGRGPFRIQGNMSSAAAQRGSTDIPQRRPTAPLGAVGLPLRRQRNP